MRMCAGEQYLGHWDGYSVRDSRYQPNNYYLHSDETGRFSMCRPIDQTFARRTRSRVSGLTRGSSRRARETVGWETPARRATSWLVTPPFRSGMVPQLDPGHPGASLNAGKS